MSVFSNLTMFHLLTAVLLGNSWKDATKFLLELSTIKMTTSSRVTLELKLNKWRQIQRPRNWYNFFNAWWKLKYYSIITINWSILLVNSPRFSLSLARWLRHWKYCVVFTLMKSTPVKKGWNWPKIQYISEPFSLYFFPCLSQGETRSLKYFLLKNHKLFEIFNERRKKTTIGRRMISENFLFIASKLTIIRGRWNPFNSCCCLFNNFFFGQTWWEEWGWWEMAKKGLKWKSFSMFFIPWKFFQPFSEVNSFS